MVLTFTLTDGSSYNAGPFEEKAIIGSSEEEATIALPSNSLSAQHAIIEPAEDGVHWQIRDLDSTTGLSDGTNLAPAFLLTDGSRLFLGDVQLDIAFAAPAAKELPVNTEDARLRAAQIARLRMAKPRHSQSGAIFLFVVLGILAFVAGFTVRYMQ